MFTKPYKAHELFMNTHAVIVVVTDTQAYHYIDLYVFMYFYKTGQIVISSEFHSSKFTPYHAWYTLQSFNELVCRLLATFTTICSYLFKI